MINRHFGAAMAAIMDEKLLTGTEVAALLDVNPSRISHMLRQKSFRRSTRQSVCVALGVSMDKLIEKSEEVAEQS